MNPRDHLRRRRFGQAWRLGALAAGLALAPAVQASPGPHPAPWITPEQPFRIIGPVYYVGSEGLSAYLMVSPAGDILLDGTLAETAPLVEHNIEALGFRLTDIKLLVNSHAHFDHAGGLARLKQDTGAKLIASAGDRWSLEHGRHFGDSDYGGASFPAVQVDQVIKDGETLRIGGIVLTARSTPGHTRGCTSWTLPVSEAGRRLQVVFPCSMTVAGNILVANKAYPTIVADYRRSFARLKAMKADVVLTSHPEVADVLGRHERERAGQTEAFVDRGALQKILAESEADFDAELVRQSATPQRRSAMAAAR